MYGLTIDAVWYILKPKKGAFRKEKPIQAETNCAPTSKPLSSIPQQLAPNV